MESQCPTTFFVEILKHDYRAYQNRLRLAMLWCRLWYHTLKYDSESSYHKLAMKYFVFILNNIDGSIISYAMPANIMAIYHLLVDHHTVGNLSGVETVLFHTKPILAIAFEPGMESQKQINPPIKDIHSELWLFIFRSMIHNNHGYP